MPTTRVLLPCSGAVLVARASKVRRPVDRHSARSAGCRFRPPRARSHRLSPWRRDGGVGSRCNQPGRSNPVEEMGSPVLVRFVCARRTCAASTSSASLVLWACALLLHAALARGPRRCVGVWTAVRLVISQARGARRRRLRSQRAARWRPWRVRWCVGGGGQVAGADDGPPLLERGRVARGHGAQVCDASRRGRPPRAISRWARPDGRGSTLRRR